MGASFGAGDGIGADVMPAEVGFALNTGGGVTGFDGAGGNGADAIGGRTAAAAPGTGGRIGPGRGGGEPFAGGRGGILIRTVSRLGAAGAPLAGFGRGGKVIRTVSFLGSGESAMIVPCRSQNKMAESCKFVTT